MKYNTQQLRILRDKKQARFDRLQQELVELDKRILDAEDEEIITTVRSLCLGPEEIAALLQSLQGNSKAPPSHANEKDSKKQEEDDHEKE